MEWNIAKSERRCSRCEAAFVEGDEFTSALFEQGADLIRRDFCPSCWQALADRAAVFSFWRTRVPERGDEARLRVDAGVVMSVFRRLAGSTEPKRLNFRYILALMLMRNKALKFIDIRRRGGQEYLVLRSPRDQAEHEVLNPQLSDEQLEQVREDLSQILEADL